jgi:hypothetical protein
MVSTIKTTPQEGPIQFRVLDVFDHPVPELARPGEIVLRLEHINKRPRLHNWSFLRSQLAPYRDAIADAIRSGAVYWVDLDYSKAHWLPRVNDSALDRILEAVKNRQLVPPQPSSEPEP